MTLRTSSDTTPDSLTFTPLPDYGGELGVLAEILWCLSFEVAHAMMDAGGRDLFSA